MMYVQGQIYILHFISHYTGSPIVERQLEEPLWTFSWHSILSVGIISAVRAESGYCSIS